jgi:hypothetical protein
LTEPEILSATSQFSWKPHPPLCHPDPDFLYVAPSITACAAFSEESRMRLANATELHRKSGGAKPRDLQCASPERNCASASPGAPKVR